MNKTEEYTNNCLRLGLNYVDTKIINSRRQIGFICPKHIDKGVQYSDYYAFKKAKIGCPYCASKYYSDLEFQNDGRIHESVKILGKYINSSTKVLCECKICNHRWMVTPNKLISGRKCPKCRNTENAKRFMKSQKQFESDVFSKQPNVEIIGEYTGAKNKVKCKCKIHGNEWITVAERLLSLNSGCPICNASVGEANIRLFLEQCNISYVSQHTFDDCVYIEKLRFDLYLPEYNILIEFQGEQHFKPVNFRGKHYAGADKDFEYLQIRDNIKKNYCKLNDIPLIEVPYWEKHNVENFLNEEFKKLNLIYQQL